MVDRGIEQNCKSELIRTLTHQHCRSEIGVLQIHFLMHTYENLMPNLPNEFLAFCSRKMTDELCELASKNTIGQSTLPSWVKLRFGRITASRLHESAQCRVDGTLVQVIDSENCIFI